MSDMSFWDGFPLVSMEGVTIGWNNGFEKW
jgi:hypothetical protein